MYQEQLRNLINASLPVFGGVVLTLISYGIIGRKWRIADPELEGVWADSMRIMRFGGPALIVFGIFILIHVLSNI